MYYLLSKAYHKTLQLFKATCVCPFRHDLLHHRQKLCHKLIVSKSLSWQMTASSNSFYFRQYHVANIMTSKCDDDDDVDLLLMLFVTRCYRTLSLLTPFFAGETRNTKVTTNYSSILNKCCSVFLPTLITYVSRNESHCQKYG